MIWKALSSETVFKRTVKFGFVPEDEKDVVSKFKVKKFPSVLMQRGAKAEIKEAYSGEMKFLALKDWVNLHSESGMGDKLSDRGAKMKWMWMNLAVETEFKTLFDPTELPSAVVFNPHKRLRFTKLDHGEDGEVKGNEAGLSGLLDKVLGGDARFKMVPGQKLPGWAKRDAGAKKAEL